MVQLIGSFVSAAKWAHCSTFKYLAGACCSSCSELQKPPTFPSSTCIDLLRGDLCMLYGVILYMLCAAACCGCIGSSKSWYLLCCNSSIADLFCQDQTHQHCHVYYHASSSSTGPMGWPALEQNIYVIHLLPKIITVSFIRSMWENFAEFSVCSF